MASYCDQQNQATARFDYSQRSYWPSFDYQRRWPGLTTFAPGNTQIVFVDPIAFRHHDGAANARD
jgi:hypothetical protein